jgi:hypothetical protein
MRLRVEATAASHRLAGEGPDVVLVNRFLEHLSVRNFAAATRRAYAYDLLIFSRFCVQRDLSVEGVDADGCVRLPRLAAGSAAAGRRRPPAHGGAAAGVPGRGAGVDEPADCGAARVV